MRIFKVKVMLDESKEQSRLIKDIEQEQYTLLMGKKMLINLYQVLWI